MEMLDATVDGQKERLSTLKIKEFPLKLNTLTEQSPKNVKNTEEVSRLIL
jgi:hypothetical protein